MYAIIDIETTGLNAVSDKITEIAIFIHDGNKIVDEFVSLINPERKIPYRITQMTGINNKMVEFAPRFFELAKKIIDFTEDTVIVGHNVAFDYNFLKNEYKSLGYEYKRKTLCTVKLSRKLIPLRKSYSLGKLCKGLNIEIQNRHRAAGDAMATLKLFELLRTIDKDLENISVKGLNSKLDKAIIDSIPEETGVYYFVNNENEIIYIGKSKNIRNRVLSHLSNNQTKKALELKNKIANIFYEITGSELIALLKESEEIKRYKPFYNTQQRRTDFNHGLYYYTDENNYIRLKIKKNIEDKNLLTSFTSQKEAREYLFRITEDNELCQKLCGLYDNNGSCFHYQIKQCKGACIGEEKPEKYNARVNEIISGFSFEKDNFFIVDKGRNETEKSVVKISNGKYSGFGYVKDELIANGKEKLDNHIQKYNNNRDVHQIIRSFLKCNKVKDIKGVTFVA
ncbi:MAG: GIY-YIG nuclease family protein [Bacteroidales bacterium]|nr:GIY-YIG nuclease family protein [Bacteroidales bacterium]